MRTLRLCVTASARPPRFKPVLAVAPLLLAVLGGVAFGQTSRADASLSRAEGLVYLNEQAVAPLSDPLTLTASAMIRAAAGRATVSLKRGGTLFIAEHSAVRVVANGVYNFNRIEVLSGSVIVASAESAPLVACQGEVRLSTAGVFRWDVQPPDPAGRPRCRFRVYDGAAAVPATTVTNALRAGQSIVLPAGDLVPVLDFSPMDLDEFHRWTRVNVVGLTR